MVVASGPKAAPYPRNPSRQLGRVTYTAGYVFPGKTPAAGPTAAVEQAASWFQNHDKLGLTCKCRHEGTYQQFLNLELLPEVKSALRSNIRRSNAV
jgi:hypothetical protein